MSRHDVAILSNEALTQLTFSVVKEQCSVAPTSAGNSIQKNAKEPHPKVYHSVSSKKAPRQVEPCSSRDVATPTSRTDATPLDTYGYSGVLGVSVNIVSPSPRCLLSRSLSSSVDSSSDTLGSSMISHYPLAQDELEKECEVSGAESNSITRPNTLSLDRQMSGTSSGSGKTTPCNIPIPRQSSSEISSHIHSPMEEKLVYSCPPGPLPSCWMIPVQREDAVMVVDTGNGGHQQSLCQADDDIARLRQQALARIIADRLKIIGDQVTTEAEHQHESELMENILSSLSSRLTWRGVVRLYRSLSRVLAQWYVEEEAPSAGLCEMFTDVWKQVLRHIVGWIADHGGWNAFISETDHSARHMMPMTPDFPCRCSDSDAGRVHYSTPQTPRRGFPTIQSSPILHAGYSSYGNESPILPAGRSPRGTERGSRVLSLTEDGMFHLDESLTFLTDSGRYTEEGELKSHDEAVFSFPSSRSSFSDMPESPLSPRPRPQSGSLVPQTTPIMMDVGRLSSSMFDRIRSRSVPNRIRPNSARRARGSEVISEREHSVDSGLEASSEASLASATSADSFTSLQFGTLGVSAMCILEAVRSMLDTDR